MMMIKSNKIKLCTKQLDDAANDYNWKTDPELAELDATSPLDMTFNEYLFMYICELNNTTSTKHEFSIETTDGEHIGNCAYYNINKFKGESEIGIILGNRQYWDKGYGTDAMLSLVEYIFSKHNFKRVHLKTLEQNIRAQHCFTKCGFTTYACKKLNGYSFILMELPREKWQTHRLEIMGQRTESALETGKDR